MERTSTQTAQNRARTAWLAVLVVVLAGPVLLHLIRSGPLPLWRQLSIVTGLVATSALVCAVALPSRMRSLTKAFGIETVVGLHRQLGILAAGFIVVHLAFVVAANPTTVALLIFPKAPPRAKAAAIGTAAIVLVVILALQQRKIRQRYEVWRWLHLFLSIVGLGASALHILYLRHLITDPFLGPMFVVLGLAVLAVFGMRWWGSMLDAGSEFMVREVRAESPSVATLVLRPRHPGGGLRFAPGQFAWVRLQRTAIEEHPFTMASSAHDQASTEFTIRGGGDFASSVRHLQPGSSVWVDGPHGSFSSDGVPSAGFVLIAAGVGITPMMSMLRTAADRGDLRPHRLIYIARDAPDMLFRDELDRLRTELDLVVTEVLRHPSDGWTGHTGGVGVELLTEVHSGLDPGKRLDYFLCGPPGMVADAMAALAALGVSDDCVHTEQFDMV